MFAEHRHPGRDCRGEGTMLLYQLRALYFNAFLRLSRERAHLYLALRFTDPPMYKYILIMYIDGIQAGGRLLYTYGPLNFYKIF